MFLEIEAVKKTARLASYSPHGIVHYQDVIVDWDESKRAEYEFICAARPLVILKVKQLYFFFMLKSSKDFDSLAKVSFFFWEHFCIQLYKIPIVGLDDSSLNS